MLLQQFAYYFLNGFAKNKILTLAISTVIGKSGGEGGDNDRNV